MGAHSLTRTQYTTDEGIKCVIRQEEQLRVAAGNPVADGTEVARPFRLKLRKIHASVFLAGGAGQAVGKFSRSLAISDVGNGLWTNATKTVQLPDYDSVPGVGQTTPNVEQTFIVTGRTGEARTF